MKKGLLALLLILNVSMIESSPANASRLRILCSKITGHTAYRICRKIGYIGAICAVGYWIARYLNDHRNTRRNAVIGRTPGDRDHAGTLTINTTGLVTIQGGAQAHGMTVRTERLDPDTQHHSLFQEQAPIQADNQIPQSRWQKIWQWLVRPSHRAVIRHIISVPQNTDIVLNTRNTHKIAHLHELPIIIDAVNGTISAHTRSGDIRITNPRGNVTVGTSGRVEILNFGRSVTVDDSSSFHATRNVGNADGVVTLVDAGGIQPIQAEYRV